MLVIEEIQVYESPVPINTLRLSASKVTNHLIACSRTGLKVLAKISCPLISVCASQGQVYAGSEIGAVQVPVCTCGRYDTCVDCVLARDPYCGWDLAAGRCVAVRSLSGPALQSLKEGDLSQCPDPGLLLLFTGGWGSIPEALSDCSAVGTTLCVFIFRPDSGCGRCPSSRKQHPAPVPGPLQFGAGPVAVF